MSSLVSSLITEDLSSNRKHSSQFEKHALAFEEDAGDDRSSTDVWGRQTQEDTEGGIAESSSVGDGKPDVNEEKMGRA